MSAGAVAELWADLIGEPGKRWPKPTPTNSANSANCKDACGVAPDSDACEALRISANPEQVTTVVGARSQKFAGVRNLAIGPESQQPCGFSQHSQDSQRSPGTMRRKALALDLASVAWTDADIAHFLDRRARLMRWGWAEPKAEKLAERLVIRDREHDERVSCIDCRHYRPGRCGNHRAAMLGSRGLSHTLAATLQRCAGYEVEGVTR